MSELTRSFEVQTNPYTDGSAREIHIWLLKGSRGVVQFKAGPQSPVSHEISLRYPNIGHLVDGWSWTGWDLGYHSPRPTHEGHEAITESCPDLDGVRCFYDGTALGACDLLDNWASSGKDDEVIWCELERRYHDWLCNGEEVFASPLTLLSKVLKRASS